MERSLDWLNQAKRDLEKAALDIKYEYFEWACFTAQQSAEKAVKALYQKLNMSVKGHSIVRMLEGLNINKIQVTEELYHLARVLDKYYTVSRYPNGFPEGKPADFFDEKIGQEALDAAHKIVTWCDDKISTV